MKFSTVKMPFLISPVYADPPIKIVFSAKEIIEKFRKRINLYGTDLDLDQAEVLLTRIDSADIVKLSTVFSIVQTLTKQLALAKTSSVENIEVTKKYYGAYIGLLEIQELVQTEYLDQIDSNYLPGINSANMKRLKHLQQALQNCWRTNGMLMSYTMQ